MTAAIAVLETIRARKLEHEASAHRDDPVHLRALLADTRRELAKEQQLNQDLAACVRDVTHHHDEVKRVLMMFKLELEADGLEVTRERLRRLALWWFSRRVEGELER